MMKDLVSISDSHFDIFSYTSPCKNLKQIKIPIIKATVHIFYLLNLNTSFLGALSKGMELCTIITNIQYLLMF